jgi:predicted glutamine amidotransferase
VLILASQPLTRNETWVPVALNSSLVLKDGAVVRTF